MFPKPWREQSQLVDKANACLTFLGHAMLPDVDAAYSSSSSSGISATWAMSG
ncbi:hypothetical protein [Cupriavidus metallidurans]|uniref:hypothetical protein n=1 Tax=Cupriavidus metallidurans TaxID=119219 RepID=UPI00164F1E42|nr:hypothetical protein [Cupriavidus metallidurans]